MKLYFVRHGETIWNTKKMFQGVKNSNLTDLGKEQAKKLKKHLKDINFTHYYCSPLGRALETINILTEDKNKPFINLIPEFKEINMGEIEGMESETAFKLYPDEMYNLWNGGTNYNPEKFKGESFQSVYERVRKGLNFLISQHSKEDNILIVSHALALNAIFEAIKGNSFDCIKEKNIPKNTSVTVVEYKNNKWEILLFSDTSHLS